MSKRALQGAFYGALFSFAGHWFKIADKKIIADRALIDPGYIHFLTF